MAYTTLYRCNAVGQHMSHSMRKLAQPLINEVYLDVWQKRYKLRYRQAGYAKCQQS